MAHHKVFAGTFVLYIAILAFIAYIAFRPISESYLDADALDATTKSDGDAYSCNAEGGCFKNTSPTHFEVTLKEPTKRIKVHAAVDMVAPLTVNGSLVATAADVEKGRFPGPRGETGPQGIPGIPGIPGTSFDPSQTYELVQAKTLSANKGSGWGTAVNVNAPVHPESLYALHFGDGKDIHGRQAGMGYIANQPNKIYSSRGTLASHIHQDDDFMMYSSGWNPLIAIKGGSGDTFVRGKATVGELCIDSMCITKDDIKKLKMGSAKNGKYTPPNWGYRIVGTGHGNFLPVFGDIAFTVPTDGYIIASWTGHVHTENQDWAAYYTIFVDGQNVNSTPTMHDSHVHANALMGAQHMYIQRHWYGLNVTIHAKVSAGPHTLTPVLSVGVGQGAHVNGSSLAWTFFKG